MLETSFTIKKKKMKASWIAFSAPVTFSSQIHTNNPKREYKTPKSELSYTNLGNNLPNISRIALGTWSWGNKLLYSYDTANDSQLEQTFTEALTQGISLIDTADSYGVGPFLNGRSEKLIGQYLKKHPDLGKDVKIATKYASYPWRLTRKSIVNAAERSCERLGRPADVGQIHWPVSKYLPLQERILWDGIVDAYEAGYCKHIGISNYGSKSMLDVYEYIKNERGVNISSLQIQSSLLCRKNINTCHTATDLGLGVITYSPLCLGLLSGKYDDDNLPSSLARKLLYKNIKPGKVVDALTSVAKDRGISVAQVALAWCLCKQKEAVVLVGARRPEQISDCIAASQVLLTSEEMIYLEMAAERSGEMIQNSFQTD